MESILFAFNHANIFGKGIIFFLIIASIISWVVMANKYAVIRKARKENKRFMYYFRRAKFPLAIYEKKLAFETAPLFQIYQEGCKELCLHLLGSVEVDESFPSRLAVAKPIAASSMDSIRSAMERTVGEEMLKLEDQLIFLASAVSGAPFVGLLGTVWGVMDAFSGVAMAGQANLAAMAPGVSGSLLTTVTALIVAIPAMFGYNYLINTLRQMTVEMENFSTECASDIEHKYARKRL